jgi:hypothetical protein
LVDLEELELGLVDILAIALTWSEVSSGPAVMAAIPTFLTAVTRADMVPVEGHLGSGRDCSRMR